MLVHAETERENDRQETTFKKNGGTVHLTGFFNQSHSEMYTCVLSRLVIITILKPLAGNCFPADVDSQLKVH